MYFILYHCFMYIISIHSFSSKFWQQRRMYIDNFAREHIHNIAWYKKHVTSQHNEIYFLLCQ